MAFSVSAFNPLKTVPLEALKQKNTKNALRFGYSGVTSQIPFKGDTVTIQFGSTRKSGHKQELSNLFPKTLPQANFINSFNAGKQTLINGEVKPWTGETTPVDSVVMTRNTDGSLNPVTVGELASMSKTDALEALNAAKTAYNHGNGEWPATPLEKRIEAVGNFINEMKSSREDVANLLMLEIGKGSKSAYGEFDRTIEYLEETLDLARDIAKKGGTVQDAGKVLYKEGPKARGVTLVMGPSNYPVNETLTVLIPAILMGNTTICKLPKHGALSMTPIYDAFAKSFPKGVANFISGDGATLITPIMESGDIDTFAFIGGTNTAKKIMENHPDPMFLNKVLGLGAKNPSIILPDANLDIAVAQTLKGSLSFNGQRCTALKTVFVPRDLADDFTKKYVAGVESMKLGMPYDESADITPVPVGNIPYYQDLVTDAVSKGAKIMNEGGGTVSGTLYKPAVLYPVTSEMRVFHEEQFGPVVPIVPYDNIEDVLSAVENSDFAQQASVFGGSSEELQPVVSRLQHQIPRINLDLAASRGPDILPFVGRKESALGVLSISEALERFSTPGLLVVPNDDRQKDQLDTLKF